MGPVEHNQRPHYVSLNSPGGNISGEVFFSTIVLLLVVNRVYGHRLMRSKLMYSHIGVPDDDIIFYK